MFAILLALAVPAAARGARANPADDLTHIPIEASVYDPATHCTEKQRPGMLMLHHWLADNFRGVSWGSYPACYGRRGKLLRNVNKTVADRDHVHIGMTKAGAVGKTSFWRHTG